MPASDATTSHPSADPDAANRDLRLRGWLTNTSHLPRRLADPSVRGQMRASDG